MYPTRFAPARDSLADHYGELLEDLEDINYRMFDLYFRRYPTVRAAFPDNRQQHPQLVEALFGYHARLTEADKLTRFLRASGCRTLNCSHLRQLRLCFLQAVEDVLFDEASEALLEDCASAFDHLFIVLLSSGRKGRFRPRLHPVQPSL